MKVYWKRLHPDAQAPSKSTPGSVGWDLRCVDTFTLHPKTPPTLVDTGIAVACPPRCWLKIFERSGLASRGIFVHGGVIDIDYRGEIKVILYKASGAVPHAFAAGDRIAQMVVMPQWDVADWSMLSSAWEWEEADEKLWTALALTDRAEKGFGSSGR